jgi:hypothetical protein
LPITVSGIWGASVPGSAQSCSMIFLRNGVHNFWQGARGSYA